ncbi:MAG: amino acid adenylation domain-containing protein, partial [Rubrobacter sp.]|nr:amino acid adenylation domain-containing protein [Rubrobacter sp.]
MDREGLCLHELFEEQARKTPEETAVADERGELTYGELDRTADRLAAYLRGEGVEPDEVVGVYLERRLEFVVACLAALKAGGAFLPLELAYPPSLLGDVLDDSEPRIVLTQEGLTGRLPGKQARFCLDDGWEDAIGGDAGTTDGPRPGPENLMFVSYSSGTTGKPKGIANPHRAAVRSYLWRFGLSDYRPGDRVGCGVFFIWEAFRPLLRGATTFVVPDEVIYDPAALVRYLEERRITETLMTPSLLEAVLDEGGPNIGERLNGLRTLWLNGEVVTKTLARRALKLLPNVRLLNLYSVSETHEIAAGDLQELVESAEATHCPVGRPKDPDRLYLLDGDSNPVPAGTPGELYVGGELLARGYVKLPEKTAERFLPDQFSPEVGARMYRTGDKARLLSDGNLEILGRVDFMVKIRGYSIELGAVEAAILERLAVESCVVVAEGEEGEDKRLVAYLVPSSDPDDRPADWRVDPRTGRSSGIRRVLQESLPHYMIPAVFVEVGSLPLQDTTGKVDRKKLPPPPARVAPAAFDPGEHRLPPDASRHEKEVLLARLWEHVLGLEEGDVRRDDDFFDVGGHSLAAAQLLGHVEDAFGARFSMPEFLARPTVEGLCDAIEKRQKGGTEGQAGYNPSRPAVDLRAEAILEPDIAPERRGSGDAPLGDARRVFLTGATGFLGAFLLDELLSRTEAEVRCLVRLRKGEHDPMAPLRANLERYGLWTPERAGRIVPAVGDLSAPLLGMPEDAFDRLAREVDVIVHAGAAVNLIYPYEALKPANVGGTREVLRLACRGEAKPLHHVSTNGIFPPDEGVCREDADLNALADAREDGYGQSKWVAEKLVWEAAKRGLPVCVYRPGNVSGHSVTGASNPRDALGAVIAESLRIGYAPDIEGWRMEMTPVNFVCGTMRHIASDPANAGHVFHLADPDPVFADEIFSWLEDMGYRLGRLSYPEWLEALQKAPRREADGDDFAGILLGTAPDTHELWDGNAYDDANTR